MAKKGNSTGIEINEKIVAITKHGVIHYVPVRPLKDTEGFIPRLDTENLRDKS